MATDENEGTVRLTLVLHPDRPRQALILERLYAVCGKSGRFFGLSPRMEVAMLLHRAWSLGQVRITQVPGLPVAMSDMLSDMGVQASSPGSAGDGASFTSPTSPDSHPATGPSVSESRPSVSEPVSPTESGTDRFSALPERTATPTRGTPVEGGENTPALDEDSPLAKLAKGVKW